MASARKIEIDKGAFVALPSGDTRTLDIKEGAKVLIYPDTWGADDVLKIMTAMGGTT